MEDVTLCSVCKAIDIEQLSKPNGYLLHANLQELQDCACVLCERAYINIRKKPAQHAAIERPWLDTAVQSEYLARVVRATLLGDPSLAIVVRRRGDATVRGLQWDFVNEHAWVSLYTNEHDPAVAYGVNWVRLELTKTSSPESIDVARAWIASCLAGTCCGTKMIRRELVPNPHERPSRLIEIQNPRTLQLRLVDGKTSKAPYAALSYTWGTAPAVWQTVKVNLRERQRLLSYDDLPRTLQDAVTATVKLALRYLWIDSLCICQDDDDDWAKEASRMAYIYMGAHVTLAADASQRSTSGMYNVRSRSQLPHLGRWGIKNRLSNGGESTLYLRPNILRESIDEGLCGKFERHDNWDKGSSILATRGWCCQEKLLSPRVLHFTDTQLFWECRHSARSEDNLFFSPRARRLADVLEYSVAEDHGTVASPPPKGKSTGALLDLWQTTIVAESSHVQDLVAGLCWRRHGVGCKATVYRAPSWSWASQDSRVSHSLAIRENMIRYAEVLHAEVSSADGNGTGAVTAGFLVIRGPVVCGRLGAPAMIAEADNVIAIDCDEEEFTTLVLDDGIILEATLDDDESNAEEVLACIMLEDSWAEHGVLFALLLQKVDDDSGSFRRVGLATKQQQQLSAAQLLALKTMPSKTVTVV
ncbi:hypothetical protein LTR17_015989 [Elasticomyces elasticus]|nr:hypothetical protein LTR17_015989 [Elasticomyces elasticus]